MAEQDYNDLVNEAQRVEEALKDFISTIIQHYRDYGVEQKYLDQYQHEISNAETLLDVFSIMKDMYDRLMQNIERITNEVSLEKDPTLKNIIAKYEQELKVHVKLHKELKDSLRQQDEKLKDKDKEIRELRATIEDYKNDVRVLQKRNSELSTNLHDEIRQKLKIFKELKDTTEMTQSQFGMKVDDSSRRQPKHKRSISNSSLAKYSPALLKFNIESSKSPKALSRKGSMVDQNGSAFYTDNKSFGNGTQTLTMFGSRRDRKPKPAGNIALNFEDDLKKFFNGYFTSKSQFMSINNSLNKSSVTDPKGKVPGANRSILGDRMLKKE